MRSGNRFQELLDLQELEGAATQSHKCLKISYSTGLLLDLGRTVRCKDLPRDFDPSILQCMKVLYSRDFLLSVGRTERCKNLPTDFDPSMLHESEDATTGLLITPFHSDSRHFGSLSQGLIQNPFNDMATASSSKIQGSNGCDLLKKCEKPYRPPHFYKVMSNSGRKSTDSSSEETLGSDVLSKKDSFQLTSKDQHKAIKEKDNKPIEEPKSEGCVVPPASHCGSIKGLLPTPTLSSRSLEKNSETKSSTNSSLSEVASADGNADSKEIQPEKCSGFNDQLHETSNGNSEELNQLPKPAKIHQVYTDLEHDQNVSDGGEDRQYKSSNDQTASSHLDQKDLKLSSELSKTSLDKLHSISRFESCLPHNLISGTGFTEKAPQSGDTRPTVLPLSSSDEKPEFTDEYNLPDEDTLFTFDYSIDKSPEADLLVPSTQAAPLGSLYNIYAQPGYSQVPHLHTQHPQPARRSFRAKKMNSRPYPQYPRIAPPYPLQQSPLFFVPYLPPSYYGMPNPALGFGAYGNQVPFNGLYKNKNPRK